MSWVLVALGCLIAFRTPLAGRDPSTPSVRSRFCDSMVFPFTCLSTMGGAPNRNSSNILTTYSGGTREHGIIHTNEKLLVAIECLENARDQNFFHSMTCASSRRSL